MVLPLYRQRERRPPPQTRVDGVASPGLGNFSARRTVSAKIWTALGQLGLLAILELRAGRVGGGQGEDSVFSVHVLETALLDH